MSVLQNTMNEALANSGHETELRPVIEAFLACARASLDNNGLPCDEENVAAAMCDINYDVKVVLEHIWNRVVEAQ